MWENDIVASGEEKGGGATFATDVLPKMDRCILCRRQDPKVLSSGSVDVMDPSSARYSRQGRRLLPHWDVSVDGRG